MPAVLLRRGMISGLLKPEYLYRPRQLVRRVLRPNAAASRAGADGLVDAPLPWGGVLRVSPADDIGRQLITLGVFDLVLTETLWRLADAGERAVDVGANVGYATAVLAERVGRDGATGEVVSFEPHPVLYEELVENCRRLEQRRRGVPIRTIAAAVSSAAGTVRLEIPVDFRANRGIARVVAGAEEAPSAPAARAIHVPAVTLDEVFGGVGETIGVMKVDVEGHEMHVIRGAAAMLSQRRIRDIVFEEHRPYPSEVTDALESHGYRIFRLQRTFRAPELLPPDSTIERARWEATNFLATCEPARAVERFKRRGWACLRG